MNPVSTIGCFTAESPTVSLGDPIWIKLTVTNTSRSSISLSLPHGRADGIALSVISGANYELLGMENDPEPGLVGDHTLLPGESCSKRYLISQWLTLRSRMTYEIECTIRLQVREMDTDAAASDPMSTIVDVSTTITIAIV